MTPELWAVITVIISIIISGSSLILGRKDKAVKDSKESGANQRLLEYRLDELTKKVDQILVKLDKYDEEIEEKVEKALNTHVKEYHKNIRSTKSKGV